LNPPVFTKRRSRKNITKGLTLPASEYYFGVVGKIRLITATANNTITLIINTTNKRLEDFMLNFVKKAFRVCFVIELWLNLVSLVIAGGVFGYMSGASVGMLNGNSVVWIIVGATLGVILGALVGVITNVLIGGFVVIFLELGKDVSDIKAANARIEADIAVLKAVAADIRNSSADTAAVFQKMANRQAAPK